MDWNYLYSLVAFVIGGLAGFQGVYERYKKDSPKASTTLPGFFYLLTRALFPATLFGGLYAAGLIDSKLLITSLACGAGAEIFLRTKIFIKQEQKAPGNIEDLLKGPLDLLRWYQNLFLEAASTGLAQSRKAFVDKHLPAAVKFQDLCERVLRNIEAYNPPPPDLKTEIEKLKEEFDKKKVDERSRAELAINTTMVNLEKNREEAIAWLAASPELRGKATSITGSDDLTKWAEIIKETAAKYDLPPEQVRQDMAEAARKAGNQELATLLALAASPETAEIVRGISDIADPAKIEQQYRYKLGYLVYNHVGPKGFTTLLFS